MSDRRPARSLFPYSELLALAERQAELAREGDVASMAPLWPLWEELATQATASPPPAAAPLLQRAAALTERTSAQLRTLHDGLMRDVALTARAGRAARGYSSPRRRRPRIDRTL